MLPILFVIKYLATKWKEKQRYKNIYILFTDMCHSYIGSLSRILKCLSWIKNPSDVIKNLLSFASLGLISSKLAVALHGPKDIFITTKEWISLFYFL